MNEQIDYIHHLIPELDFLATMGTNPSLRHIRIPYVPSNVFYHTLPVVDSVLRPHILWLGEDPELELIDIPPNAL